MIVHPPLHRRPQALVRRGNRRYFESQVAECSPRTCEVVHVHIIGDIDLTDHKTKPSVAETLPPIKVGQDPTSIAEGCCKQTGITERRSKRLGRNAISDSRTVLDFENQSATVRRSPPRCGPCSVEPENVTRRIRRRAIGIRVHRQQLIVETEGKSCPSCKLLLPGQVALQSPLALTFLRGRQSTFHAIGRCKTASVLILRTDSRRQCTQHQPDIQKDNRSQMHRVPPGCRRPPVFPHRTNRQCFLNFQRGRRPTDGGRGPGVEMFALETVFLSIAFCVDSTRKLVGVLPVHCLNARSRADGLERPT